MKMKKLLGVLLALSIFGSFTSAQAANEMTMTPSIQDAGLGDFVTIDLNLTLDTRSIGGGWDVFFDNTVLSFVSFDWNAAFNCAIGCPADSAFERVGDSTFASGPGELDGFNIANFAGIQGGPYFVGTLTFQVIGLGNAALSMADNDSIAGFWLDYNTAANIGMTYTGASVSTVPLPAAAWLMIAGVGFLFGFGRRKMGANA